MAKKSKKKATKKMSRALAQKATPEEKIKSGFKEIYERENKKSCKKTPYHQCNGALYFVGFIGALVYYISTATGFWNGFLGVLKAMVWPAFLIYEVLKYLGA
jgi:hypothetical protein